MLQRNFCVPILQIAHSLRRQPSHILARQNSRAPMSTVEPLLLASFLPFFRCPMPSRFEVVMKESRRNNRLVGTPYSWRVVELINGIPEEILCGHPPRRRTGFYHP
ncbi:hypothetical protein A0H81_14903 [Grifola frondosa]|uniref:Uncharacterized protein n=1 Tax=Grifola frondosa TaxID=5627 RepID=A0A1C7LLM4_GRIFR|nr:hypothetical protein A0H81_14903 [Grifola frondosa]